MVCIWRIACRIARSGVLTSNRKQTCSMCFSSPPPPPAAKTQRNLLEVPETGVFFRELVVLFRSSFFVFSLLCSSFFVCMRLKEKALPCWRVALKKGTPIFGVHAFVSRPPPSWLLIYSWNKKSYVIAEFRPLPGSPISDMVDLFGSLLVDCKWDTRRSSKPGSRPVVGEAERRSKQEDPPAQSAACRWNYE